MLPLSAGLDVREYVAADGSSPYAKWFKDLNAPAAAKVAIAITRMAQGNLSYAKSVSGGGFKNTASTSDPVIESTLVGTVSAW